MRSQRRSNAIPKRQLTGYIIYASEVRKQVIDKNPNQAFGDISRLVGSEWKALPNEIRTKYDVRALIHNKKVRERAQREAENPSLAMDGQNGTSTPKMTKRKLAKLAKERMKQFHLSIASGLDDSLTESSLISQDLSSGSPATPLSPNTSSSEALQHQHQTLTNNNNTNTNTTINNNNNNNNNPSNSNMIISSNVNNSINSNLINNINVNHHQVRLNSLNSRRTGSNQLADHSYGPNSSHGMKPVMTESSTQTPTIRFVEPPPVPRLQYSDAFKKYIQTLDINLNMEFI